MQFSTLIIASFASIALAMPAIKSSPADRLLTRAINYGAFTADELANPNPETCCCCKPVSQIDNVDVLHRILAANQAASAKEKRAIDYSQFTEAELSNQDVETCCCCVPPQHVQSVSALHRLIAASQ